MYLSKRRYTFWFIFRNHEISFKVTFAPNLAKKLSSLFYYLILLFQLSVANPENFEEFKAREVLKIRKEKTGILPTSRLFAMAVKTNSAKFALCTKTL